MEKETASFLLNLLNAQQLNIGAPDFEDVLTLVVQAKRELTAITNDSQSSSSEAAE